MARNSVVQVSFKESYNDLSYYNDQFDLKVGDLVYVEGKLEGKQGVVEEVNYNFKIKLSEYKRVIAVADTSVKGEFYMEGAQYITFEKNALPRQKIATWFFPPAKEEDYA